MRRFTALLLMAQIFLVQGARVHACTAHGLGGIDPHVHLSAFGAWFPNIEHSEQEACTHTSHDADHPPGPHDDGDAVTLPDEFLHVCSSSAAFAAEGSAVEYGLGLDSESAAIRSNSATHSTVYMPRRSQAWGQCAHLTSQLVI